MEKAKTIEKIKQYIVEAGEQDCELLVFWGALLTGYPFWLVLTQGTAFDGPQQKALHAHYARNPY